MNATPTDVLATLEWHSDLARHADSMVLPRAALQADGTLARAAASLDAGPAPLPAEAWLQPRDQLPVTVPADGFRLQLAPLPGRHYPRMAFAGLASGPRDLRPCRVLARDGARLMLDVNHPLAGRDARLTLTATAREAAPGRFQQLLEGPGMQRPPGQGEACYLPEGACGRQDESSDAGFYAQPRLVHHLDAVCRAELAALHAGFLRPGQAVLDLMSSWVTHLPEPLPDDLRLRGLGMNGDELEANPRLSERRVHDLNRQPTLPYGTGEFDLVLCAASLEYLIHPREVVAEVARVLRPGGQFVLSFSDRWFPPKAIRVWSELHPFERLGMALWLLAEAGFTDLHTRTLRGLKRPADDKYAAQRDTSDPLFAAWGRRAESA
jgi:SAM-dependent methyltransferase